MNIYDFNVQTMEGETVSLRQYEGQPLLIVNTASKCGFTPQFKDLQNLYETYKEDGFLVLGFPCGQFMNQEFDNNDQIQSFCSLEFGVDFPMFDKIDVNGTEADPLFEYLKEAAPFQGFDMSNPSNKMLKAMIDEKFPTFAMGNAIKWNFTKFLVDRKGNVVERFESPVDPRDIEPSLKKVL
tara:strand:- start:172 stop:717 length:546 start_codon:yes stop_codon:yes gene_type:complete